MKKTKNISLLLVDDHAFFLKSLRKFLKDHDEVVHVLGQARDGRRAIEKVRVLSPDVTIMDINMPGMDGIETTRRLVAGGAKTRILILSMCTDPGQIKNALAAGAAGFVRKDSVDRELLPAIQTVHCGRIYKCHSAALNGRMTRVRT
ncbi:MAG: response regulator transcription factor [Verrucomicrobiae bacterium]|nr:response regulator transcription factor [Verrucomicrobiae bacterium]